MAGMNVLGFAVSVATQWHYHLDLIGTGAFVVSAVASHAAAPAAVRRAPRQLLLTGLVATWGTRLAGFLFYRALQYRHDARLDDLLKSVGGAATFWGLSYVWGQVSQSVRQAGRQAGRQHTIVPSLILTQYLAPPPPPPPPG